MKRLAASLFACLGLASCEHVPTTAVSSAIYDVVISGGRVMDPESGLDAIRDVGIRGGTIAAISTSPLAGRTVLQASGHVVAPGFIDLHSHGMFVPSMWMQAFDGVTTALELEGGNLPIAEAYAVSQREGRPLNYGYSASWSAARSAVLAGTKLDGSFITNLAAFARPDWRKVATPAQSAQVLALVEQAVAEGALGIGLLLGYAPESNHDEYLGAARIAARYGVPTFTHLRHANPNEPGTTLEGHEELIALAAMTGAHMHLCHFNATAARKLPEMAPLLRESQAKGLRISVEAYPYGAGSTVIGASFLDPASFEAQGGRVGDLFHVPGGKRIDSRAELAELRSRDPSATVVIFYLDESDAAQREILDMAVLYPEAAIASDAIWWVVNGRPLADPVWPLPEGAYAHPRSAGTFTRVLGRYVRERRQLTLMEALRRSTLVPARILEEAAPQMRRKGRVRVGADADLVVFDPQTVIDRATYANPRQTALGMRHVLVNGVPVIRDAVLDTSARPGLPVRGPVGRKPQEAPSAARQPAR